MRDRIKKLFARVNSFYHFCKQKKEVFAIGRNAKPIALHIAEGNPNRLTKRQIGAREKAEKSLYTGTTFKESPVVRGDLIAHREFLRLKKLYKKIPYMDGLDEQIINRYCLLISQEQMLGKTLERMLIDVDEVSNVEDRIAIYKAVAGVTDKVMKVRDMLLKVEDRLFLNPLAKVKNLPKLEKKEEKPPSKFSRFTGEVY